MSSSLQHHERPLLPSAHTYHLRNTRRLADSRRRSPPHRWCRRCNYLGESTRSTLFVPEKDLVYSDPAQRHLATIRTAAAHLGSTSSTDQCNLGAPTFRTSESTERGTSFKAETEELFMSSGSKKVVLGSLANARIRFRASPSLDNGDSQLLIIPAVPSFFISCISQLPPSRIVRALGCNNSKRIIVQTPRRVGESHECCGPCR